MKHGMTRHSCGKQRKVGETHTGMSGKREARDYIWRRNKQFDVE